MIKLSNNKTAKINMGVTMPKKIIQIIEKKKKSTIVNNLYLFENSFKKIKLIFKKKKSVWYLKNKKNIISIEVQAVKYIKKSIFFFDILKGIFFNII